MIVTEFDTSRIYRDIMPTSPGYKITKIKMFKEKWLNLSNFSLNGPLEYQGRSFKTVEHAYQAAKTFNMGWRDAIRDAKHPRQAKAMGRKAPLRPDWEDVKLDVMEEILRVKFTTKENAQKTLLETDDAELIEGNFWHDNYWGDCTCVNCESIEGQNHLGKLLMKIREELRLGYCDS